jgi:selenoprotein W-related protein
MVTFAQEVGSVTLIPDATGSVFEIRLEVETIWSRKERGHFPQLRQIKQSVRDRIVPGRSLGHTDAPSDIWPRDISALDLSAWDLWA